MRRLRVHQQLVQRVQSDIAQQLEAHAEPHSAQQVHHFVEGEGAGPTSREVIGRDAGVRRAGAPIEIHLRIGAFQHPRIAVEVTSLEVFAPQAAVLAPRRRQEARTRIESPSARAYPGWWDFAWRR